jgi:Holliday junction resolvase RusA-like endonuclease
MSKEIFIPGNTPSSKNSKINTTRGSFMSKTVKKYLRSFGIQTFSSSKKTVTKYKTISYTFPEEELKCFLKDHKTPLVLGFHFVRGTKHKFDFGNICQIVLDLLTALDLIEDDNMDFLIPMPYKRDNKWYSYDKENPGVYIKILE